MNISASIHSRYLSYINLSRVYKLSDLHFIMWPMCITDCHAGHLLFVDINVSTITISRCTTANCLIGLSNETFARLALHGLFFFFFTESKLVYENNNQEDRRCLLGQILFSYGAKNLFSKLCSLAISNHASLPLLDRIDLFNIGEKKLLCCKQLKTVKI